LRKSTRRTLAIAIIVLILLLGIGAEYTVLRAPPILNAQSSAEIKGSILSVARSFENASFTDGSGSYTFRFGFDYPDTPIPAGSATVFKVYAALTSQQITSFFTRGVSLALQSGSLLVDGRFDSGVKIDPTIQANVSTIEFEFVNTSLPQGTHNVTARLILSTVDVDYIGFYTGATQVVQLNGTFLIGG